MNQKELLGQEIAKRIKDGEVIGIGTGSTVDAALQFIAKRIKKENLTVFGVPSSFVTARRCEELGIYVLDRGYSKSIAWGFDGADEVDPKLNLIKGGGGALLQEKVLAARCKKFVVIVDESKIVKRLGEKFPVPIEVIPEAVSVVKKSLKTFGATSIELRQGSGIFGPVFTEQRNMILDVRFKKIGNDFESQIKSLVGVVETGLFIGYSPEVLVASKKGIKTL